MNETSIKQAAARLIKARESGKGLERLPVKLSPQNLEEAYAVQDAVIEELGPIGGWKVGARGPEALPNCAPLARQLILSQGEAVPAQWLRLRGVEAEIGFKLGADLPPRDKPYEIADVAAHIESVHPTLEIVESRFINFRVVEAMSVLADSNSNGALIVGPAVAAPPKKADRYTHLNVALRFDGVDKVRAMGGNPAVDLLRLLAWLANHAAARCGGLKRGEIVTTGSHTGMEFAPAGTRVEADFVGMGGVAVRL
jgi:2-keto-4-pentenoate hydratase